MITINTYGQYFTVTSPNFDKLVFMLKDFNKLLYTYKQISKKENVWSKPVVERVVDKKFFIIEKDIDEQEDMIRYPLTILNDFITYIESNFIEINIDIKNNDVYQGTTISINSNPDYEPRDYQKAYINKIVTADINNLLIDLYTGYGKTFIMMNSLSRMKKRFSLFVLSRYIPKWIGDITNLTDIEEDEICVIKGMKTLIEVLETPPEEREHYKCYLLSLTTVSSFINHYLKNELKDMTSYKPDQLFERLQSTIVFNDESHQEFYNVFKITLYSNIKLFIGLTATLVNNDEHVNYIYKTLFPDDHRISNLVKYEPYINVLSIRYRFRKPKAIRYKNTFGYNQSIFEKSLTKYHYILDNYFKLISGLAMNYYVKKKKDNDKLLIFMGTVNMCILLRDYLKKHLNNDLAINKYTEEDPYEVIDETDIIVSTIASAGTALDIPNLITVIQTVNINSKGANLQTIGRLRKLKDKTTTFIYTWSSDIQSHYRYHIERLKLFRSRAKEIKILDYNNLL